MSKIGKTPVDIPPNVNIEIKGNVVNVKGPKGTLTFEFHPKIEVKVIDKKIIVERKGDDKFLKALHGTTRQIIKNMIIGVTEGYRKVLVVEGMGYKVNMEGNKLVLNVGYSHPVYYAPPQDIKLTVQGNKIIVEGIDKQKVGQVAAEIRRIKEPDPYKGKGIRYEDEKLRLKPGKAAATRGG
ncbi:MAG: 50S ribosomal protein L6 [candidate division WOR-3 bacterium]